MLIRAFWGGCLRIEVRGVWEELSANINAHMDVGNPAGFSAGPPS